VSDHDRNLTSVSPSIGYSFPEPARRIYCNRTLNVRSLGAIGFDMDYTLVHYKVEIWERRAYEYARIRLGERGFPVDRLEFDPELVCPGLIIDTELGNVVKANRFGYVKLACHGTRELNLEERREAYSRVFINLADPRWVFMNTLFTLSECCLYMQLVDLLDLGQVDAQLGVHAYGYRELYRDVRDSLDETHLEGQLKAEIVRAPEQYVVVDTELPLTLQDMRSAGKRLVLITNSEWDYTRAMMSFAFDSYLPAGQTWRDLFDLIFVLARKPAFFEGTAPVFRVVDDETGYLQPHHSALESGAVYVGGHAGLVERHLGVPGEEILYIGDHIYADVHVSKHLLRWRTALVLRSLEDEITALAEFGNKMDLLAAKMGRKEALEHEFSQLRLMTLRSREGYARSAGGGDEPRLSAQMKELRRRLVELDAEIAEMARQAGMLGNARWGLMMRAGNDKSKLARQIERYADIYTSRVSNFLRYTPFAYLRSPRGSLPHDVAGLVP
jgi:5'-nucleotidase